MEKVGALEKREVESKLKALRPLVKKVLQGGLIRSDKSNQEAADARRVVVTTSKFVDRARKSVTGPLDQAKKAAMELFRPMVSECKEALGLIDEKLTEYEMFVKEEAERERWKVIQREEKRLAQLRRNEEKKLAEAKSKEERLEVQRAYNDKKELVQEEAVAAEQTIVEEPTKTEGTQVRMLWDFELLDMNEVPDLYLKKEVNSARVLDYARNVKNPKIRGLRLFQKPSRASRSL